MAHITISASYPDDVLNNPSQPLVPLEYLFIVLVFWFPYSPRGMASLKASVWWEHPEL